MKKNLSKRSKQRRETKKAQKEWKYMQMAYAPRQTHSQTMEEINRFRARLGFAPMEEV